MAIHPIDLSTIYSQMDKLSQLNTSQLNAAQTLSSQFTNENVAQLNQMGKQVNATSPDGSSAAKISADGNNGQQQPQEQSERRKDDDDISQDSDKPEEKKRSLLDDPLLGQYIDITR